MPTPSPPTRRKFFLSPLPPPTTSIVPPLQPPPPARRNFSVSRQHHLQQAELEEESSTRLSSSNSNNKTTTKLNFSTPKISKSISDTTEKKTNKNTIRVNEEKNISKVTPPVIHTNYNNTNNIFTYDTVKKYSSKVDRNKDKKKRQEEAQYYLPEFLRENEKTNIQDCNSKLNSVASTSENVDLPHKRYSRK